MREAPSEFRVATRIQWVCAAVHAFLGEKDFANISTLMAGYGSVLDRPGLERFASAAFALRQLGISIASGIQLRQAVYDAEIWEKAQRSAPDFREPPFEIDVESRHYAFRLRTGAEQQAARMAAALLDGFPFRTHTMSKADPSRPMAVAETATEGAPRIPLNMQALPPLPPTPQHDTSPAPRGPITVSLAELEDVARRLDAIDATAPERPRGNWQARLREADGRAKFKVLRPDRVNDRLDATDVLDIEGVKHLLGLPGTGKSTLIMLLLIWLDDHGYRCVVLLPSIEVSLNLLGDLRFYGADVGLLVGQSPETRISHARKMAERLGADESHGFGRSAPGADLLGLTCALAAFDTDPDGDGTFPHLLPPCTSVLQKRRLRDGTAAAKETRHLCPLSSACGRLKAPRDLASRRIWLGHVLSMDTRISPHFAREELRYFEAVALASDIVIIDEADGAQQALDRKAISQLDLTGSKDSYEHRLIHDLLLPLAAGHNNMTAANIGDDVAKVTDFVKLNSLLVTHLQEDRQKNHGEGPIARFKDTFVTSNIIINALFAPAGMKTLSPAERAEEEIRFNAIRSFWDACVRSALFRRTETDADTAQYAFDEDHVASVLGRPTKDVTDAALAVTHLLRHWISEPLPTRCERLLEKTRAATFALVAPDAESSEHAELFRFLVGVSTVTSQFLALVSAQQAMVAEGIHHEPIFRQGISNDFARIVPEALLGRLAGLRFHHDEGDSRSSIRLQYVSFQSAPRVLLYRLHHLMRHERRARGPAVLLASATSFLAESPTFHIPVGPDFVLSRDDAGRAWEESRYIFAPIPDPENPSCPLRFSGAPVAQRERILRAMIDHYASGATPRLVEMGQDFDPGRKVALVVNSYEQVRQVKDWLRRRYPSLAPRVIAVANRIPESNEGDWITAAQVERLGLRDNWDAIVFPMKALSRGVNIVFERGPRRRDALIGTMIFLIRPHPATETLDLVAGLTGAHSQAFDARAFAPGTTNESVTQQWAQARRELMGKARRLLRFPLMASRLGPLANPFTADIMVDVLQTIGRSMRNGCKTRIVFADAAWAPKSASGNRTANDTAESSMLVVMRDILRACLSDPNRIDREIYRALYEPFLHPLERCAGVRFPDGDGSDDE